MAVPGTHSLVVRNKSAEEFPCFFRARVRSGPRPPPRVSSPWHSAQFARNSNSPSFAALESLASGFLSCARTRLAATIKCATARAPRIRIRRCAGGARKIPMLPPASEHAENLSALYHRRTKMAQRPVNLSKDLHSFSFLLEPRAAAWALVPPRFLPPPFPSTPNPKPNPHPPPP